MGERVGELSICGRLREFQQDIQPGTVDALRIGEVFVDDPFKRVKQFLFRIHSARPGRTWSPSPTPCCFFGESHDSRPVSMKIFCLQALRGKVQNQRWTMTESWAHYVGSSAVIDLDIEIREFPSPRRRTSEDP